MPPKSKKQEKLMRAVANNPDFAKKVGIKQSVGKEYMKKYNEGGDVFDVSLEDLKKMSPKERRQFERQRAYNQGIKNAKKGKIKGTISQTVEQALGPQPASERKMRKKGYEEGKKALEYKKKNMKKGGMVKKHRGDGCAKRGKTKGRMV